MTNHLSRKVHNALAKAECDLDWANRMFNESVAPESVDVNTLVDSIHAALVAAQRERGVQVRERAAPPVSGSIRQDIKIVANFITGWHPGYEDAISWGSKGEHGDGEQNAVYQAATRLLKAFAPAGDPEKGQE